MTFEIIMTWSLSWDVGCMNATLPPMQEPELRATIIKWDKTEEGGLIIKSIIYTQKSQFAHFVVLPPPPSASAILRSNTSLASLKASLASFSAGPVRSCNSTELGQLHRQSAVARECK